MGYVCATTPSGFAPGDLLQQILYTNDHIYQDEWESHKPSLSLVNYYDKTLSGNNNLLGKISDANSFANYVYNKHFNLNNFIMEQGRMNTYMFCGRIIKIMFIVIKVKKGTP